MYLCLDCGEVFSDPGSDSECVGEFWGDSAYESYAVCPRCGSTDFVESSECCNCGEDIPREDGPLCPECAKSFQEAINAMIKDYGLMDEIEYVCDSIT